MIYYAGEANNYLIKTGSDEKKWVESVSTTLRDLQKKPRNPYTVNSVSLQVQAINKNAPQRGLTGEFGFWGSTFLTNVQLLPNPAEALKMRQIEEIVLSPSLACFAPDLGGYSPPSGISDFTIDFYLSLLFLPADNGNITGLLDLTDEEITSRAITIPFSFSFLASSPVNFTVADPVKTYRLSEVFDRPFLGSIPNFNTNPTKITPGQFSRLASSATFVGSFFGWNNTQYTALSAANKDWFDDFFNLGLGGSSQAFGIGVNLSFSYFGLASAYLPN